jgi:hypothetical protein
MKAPRRQFIVCSCLAVGAALFGVLDAPAAMGASPSPSPQSAVSPAPSPAQPPAQSGTPVPVSAALSEFAGEVNTLGLDEYATSFAGAQLTSSGALVLYVVPSLAGPYLSAVAQIDSTELPYQVTGVTRSFAQLDALTMLLAKDAPQLNEQGFAITGGRQIRPATP